MSLTKYNNDPCYITMRESHNTSILNRSLDRLPESVMHCEHCPNKSSPFLALVSLNTDIKTQNVVNIESDLRGLGRGSK